MTKSKSWVKVKDDLYYDYAFARTTLQMSPHQALDWLSRGYNIPWKTIFNWPIGEEARGYGSNTSGYYH